jgi:hypothetical protein
MPPVDPRSTMHSTETPQVYTTTGKEIGMSQHGFSLTAGIIFLLIALAHLVRIVFSVPFVVQGISVLMWASLIAVVITGYLAYEGFHFSRLVPPKV